MNTHHLTKRRATALGTRRVMILKVSEQEAINFRNVITQVILTVIMILNTLLVMRFILSLAAVENSGFFASFIYSSTNSLVQPFFDLFNSTSPSGSGHIEFETFLAIVAYSLIARAVIRLVEQSTEQHETSSLRKVNQ